MADSTPRYGALQSLRGIFAICIFLHHMGIFPAGGDAGVAFFLVLSGFVMTKGYGTRALDPRFDTRRYLRRRMARVYPLHLACFAAAVLLGAAALTPAAIPALALNLALMQSWVPLPQVYFSANAVAWCLCDLTFFYLLFPWLRRLLHGATPRGTGAAVIFAAAIYAAVALLTPQQWRVGVIYINPLMRLPDFLLGMGLCLLHDRRRQGSVNSADECAVLLLAAAWTAIYARLPEALGLAAWWWPLCAVIILTFARPVAMAGAIGRLLDRPAAVRAGELSFSFYMVHQLVIRAMRIALAHWNLDWHIWLQTGVAFAGACAATWLVNRFVEEPARRWLTRS